jgi:predicted ester cyclase
LEGISRNHREMIHREMMVRLFDEVWTKGNAEAASEFYAAGDDLEALKQVARDLFRAFPDYHVTINDMVVEGDKVAVYWTGRGTHQGEWQGIAPTGRQISVDGVDIEYLSDGKIVNEEGIIDMMSMMRQLTEEIPV